MASCLVWIPVGIMVLTLIQAMIMGEMEVWAGILGLFAALGLGVVGMKPPHPSMSPLILMVAVGTLLVAPLIRTAWNRREIVKLNVERVETAYESLKLRPDNVGAKLNVAKCLFEQGMVGQAVAIGEAAITPMDKKLFADDHRMVRLWRSHPRFAAPSSLTCLRCSQRCPPESVICPKCGNTYLLDYARGWVRATVFAKIATSWIGAVLVLIGIPTAASTLPPVLALILIPLLLAMAFFLLWRTFARQVAA